MIPWSLVLILAAGWGPAASEEVRTLVLPFENESPDPLDWRGSAFEEAVTSHLQSLGMEVVDFLARNRQLRAKGFVPGEPVTRASAIVLGKDLGADRVVLGTYRALEGEGRDIEVTARVIDLTRGATVGVVEDYGPADGLPRLSNQVAKNVLRLERDFVPAGFERTAERRAKLPPGALEASALARVSFDREEQRRHLEKAVRLSGDYLEARLALGSVLLEEGLSREAVSVLAEARGEGFLYRRAYYELGHAYLAAGEPRMAFEVYRSLTEGGEATAVAFNNLGVALMRLDRYQEASAAFEKAIELEGETKTYLFNLGWGYWRGGKGALALELFEKLASADPVDAEARLLRSAAALSQAKPDLAASSRDAALVLAPHLEGVDPATIEGWERPVRSSEEGGSLVWASVPFELEEDVVALEELFDARDLRARNRNAEAVQLLQRSLYRDPSAVDSRRELAEIYHETGELDQAASELSILLWTAPSPEAHVRLARLYLEMEEPAKAREQLERALELDPAHLEAQGLRSEMTPP